MVREGAQPHPLPESKWVVTSADFRFSESLGYFLFPGRMKGGRGVSNDETQRYPLLEPAVAANYACVKAHTYVWPRR